MLAFRLLTSLSGSFLSATETGMGSTNYMDETPAQRDARMKWWSDARFGMFIHWGIYSVPAGEWNGQTNCAEWFLEQTQMPVSHYKNFAEQFNPTNFDATAWVSFLSETRSEREGSFASLKFLLKRNAPTFGFSQHFNVRNGPGVKRIVARPVSCGNDVRQQEGRKRIGHAREAKRVTP
ncbi:MAG: hypothetical protein JWR19_3873 [Pedosphaera sp.]|nr:hypothetical protein [Pedosphaera sp.]